MKRLFILTVYTLLCMYTVPLQAEAAVSATELEQIQKKAHKALEEEKYTEAIAGYTQLVAEGTAQKGDTHPHTLIWQSNLARAYAESGDFRTAQNLHQRVYGIRSQVLGKEHPDTLTSGQYLADMFASLGDYASAKKLSLQMLEARERTLGKEHPDTLLSKQYLADIYLDDGDFIQAKEQYLQLITLNEKLLGKKHPNALAAYNALADLYMRLGDYISAKTTLIYVVKSLEQTLGKDHEYTCRARLHLAHALMDLGEYAEAQKLASQILTVWEQAKSGNDPRSSYVRYTVMGEIAFGRKEYAKARELLAQAVSVTERVYGSEHVETLRRQARLAETDIQLKNFLKARTQAAIALITAQGVIPPSNATTSDIATALSGAYAGLGQTETAIFYGKASVLAARMRRGQQGGLDRDLQQTSLASTERHYHDLIELLLKNQRYEEAQAVLYFLKEDELDDASREKLTQKQQPLDLMVGKEIALYKEYMALSDKIYASGKKYREFANKMRSDPFTPGLGSKSLEAQDQMSKGQSAMLDLIEKIEKQLAGSNEHSRKAAAQLQNVAALKTILRNSTPGTALIHTLSTKDSLYLFCTTPDSLIVKQQAISRDALQKAVEAFHNDVRDPSHDPQKTAQQLYEIVLRPLQPALEKAQLKTLVFSLDGVLRYVPMAALHDGTNWLIESYAIAMFTEAARAEMKQATALKPEIAALGVSKALAGFNALPAVAKELHSIVKTSGASSGIVPGTVDIDSSFNRKSFSQRLRKGTPLIHIASHFQFNPSAQASSFLLMGDGSKMTMADMFFTSALQFKGVELLALSACDTASGLKKGDGREVESFGAMAQRHGARAVLAALWPVSDDSTALLMQNFYQRYANEKQNKAQALRAAQLSLLLAKAEPESSSQVSQRGKVGGVSGKEQIPAEKEPLPVSYLHPHYWAPFIIMGNWH